MAGHSKWAKLKHVKGKTDAQKAKLFSKLVKIIGVELKMAKGDKTAPGVRAAIEKAQAANMPKDNIDRVLSKNDGLEMERVVYEAYGPGGTALVIEGYTDNKNRTVQEIKHLLSLNNGNFAQTGAAIWAFAKGADGKLEATMPVEVTDEDGEKLSQLIEALEDHDDVNEVFTNAA